MTINRIHHHIRKHAKTAYKRIKRIRKQRSNINIFLTTIAVVMIWRGCWGLLDMYLLPNHYTLSLIIGLILGIFLLFVDNEKLDELDEKIENEEEMKL